MYIYLFLSVCVLVFLRNVNVHIFVWVYGLFFCVGVCVWLEWVWRGWECMEGWRGGGGLFRV